MLKSRFVLMGLFVILLISCATSPQEGSARYTETGAVMDIIIASASTALSPRVIGLTRSWIQGESLEIEELKAVRNFLNSSDNDHVRGLSVITSAYIAEQGGYDTKGFKKAAVQMFFSNPEGDRHISTVAKRLATS